jgi:threonine/homoserine/homoserine lactone efflux protein
MTIEMTLAFTAAFVLLALSPGPGLAAILSRALGGGMPAGMAVTSGLVIGDALFLAAAMVGLSTIANTLGPLFQIIKYAGAAYLIYLGIETLRAARKPIEITATPSSSTSLARDVGLGLFVTLGNPKPILFYGALLPTFMDLKTVTVTDFLILMSIVTIVATVVYAGYILAIDRARRIFASTRAGERLNQVTGVMLIGSGIAVASR